MSQDTANETSARPDLDVDIEQLEEWDQLRQRADQLRVAGIVRLWEIIKAPDSSQDKEFWFEEKEEPKDLVCTALLISAASREFVSKTNVPQQEIFLKQPNSSKLQLNKIRMLPDHSAIGPFIKPDDLTFRVPTFQAARVLQAMLSVPRTVFSCPAALAYYVVVRELSTVGEQKWIQGSARPSELGNASAFITGECARGVSGMARALENTADLIDGFVQLCNRWRWVNGLRHAPDKWKEVEKRRIVLAAYNDLAYVARKSGISLASKNHKDIMHLLEPGKISDLFKEFCSKFGEAASEARRNIEDALTEINQNLSREKQQNKNAMRKAKGNREAKRRLAVKFDRLALRHKIAVGTINAALESAEQAAKTAASLWQIADGSSAKRPHARVASLVAGLRRRAATARKLLDPTKAYLASVIDREVHRHSTGQLNAGELACAAAAYAALEKPVKPELDRRLKRATQILSDAISIDGTFASTSVLDSSEHGYNAAVETTEVIRAFAYLLQKVNIDVSTETFRRLLRFYEANAVRLPDTSVIGWPHDQSLNAGRAFRWTSALAILALDRITRMLNVRINNRVFRHFAVTTPKDFKNLRKTPKLSTLFYSDYGLAALGGSDFGHEDAEDHSVAFSLERMRTHVLQGNSPPGFSGSCFSVVLYGPPGTGKTTLAESLAATCDTHYVAITPSDFLVSGGTMIERRARNILRALSFLTRTVILFDEFDPMVRSRDKITDVEVLNEFAFLTPGMLPKLKLLHDCAEKRQSAYFLITNLIGSLDDAAIRAGRFDQKIGVYPPDLLSRVGRLADVIEGQPTFGGKTHLERMATTLKRSEGLGMTHLGKPGNFSRWTKPVHELPKKAIQKAILGKGKYFGASPDASPDLDPTGDRMHALLEVKQWTWVQHWDALVREDPAWSDILLQAGKPPDPKVVKEAADKKVQAFKRKKRRATAKP